MERNRVGEEKGGKGSMSWEAAVGRGDNVGGEGPDCGVVVRGGCGRGEGGGNGDGG